MSLKKVKAVQDDSSHWYLIPNELLEKFYDWSDSEGEINKELNFEDYSTGGSVNNTQLYINEE